MAKLGSIIDLCHQNTLEEDLKTLEPMGKIKKTHNTYIQALDKYRDITLVGGITDL